MLNIPSHIEVHCIKSGFSVANTQKIDIARLDKIHPIVSGNKIFKLKYNIDAAIAQEKKGIITMGGAWSNHLAATAVAAAAYGLKSIGLVRGETNDPKNAILEICRNHGMQLYPISRDAFFKESPEVQAILKTYSDAFFVPAGGDNTEGEKGCNEIWACIPDAASYTHIFCAMGTGTTFRGLAQCVFKHQKLMGIPILKVRKAEEPIFCAQHGNAIGECEKEILFGHSRKGYGKPDDELLHFMQHFYQHTNVPTDFVYTGKLMMAIDQLLQTDRLPKHASVLVMHTGGLLGNRSLKSEIFHWV